MRCSYAGLTFRASCSTIVEIPRQKVSACHSRNIATTSLSGIEGTSNRSHHASISAASFRWSFGADVSLMTASNLVFIGASILFPLNPLHLGYISEGTDDAIRNRQLNWALNRSTSRAFRLFRYVAPMLARKSRNALIIPMNKVTKVESRHIDAFCLGKTAFGTASSAGLTSPSSIAAL